MSDYMLRKMFFPAVVFTFGGGFFIGFVVAVYAAVTLFGTVAITP
jgi:predicted membrane protein